MVVPVLLLLGLLLQTPSMDYWHRASPLQNRISVVEVSNATLRLGDGRNIELLSIVPTPGVSPEELDEFLRVATLQGIEIQTSGPGVSPSVTAEPMFYNWCGTRSGFRRWAGTYTPADLESLAVFCGYAVPAPNLDHLSELQRWRLNGALAIRLDKEGDEGRPDTVSETGIRYDSQPHVLQDLDAIISLVTDTPIPD